VSSAQLHKIAAESADARTGSLGRGIKQRVARRGASKHTGARSKAAGSSHHRRSSGSHCNRVSATSSLIASPLCRTRKRLPGIQSRNLCTRKSPSVAFQFRYTGVGGTGRISAVRHQALPALPGRTGGGAWLRATTFCFPSYQRATFRRFHQSEHAICPLTAHTQRRRVSDNAQQFGPHGWWHRHDRSSLKPPAPIMLTIRPYQA